MPDALQFPQNRDAMAKDGRFHRPWLGFFNKIYDRLKAADSVGQISTATIASAGGAYDQAHTQTMVTAINEQQEKINAILAALQK